MFSYGWAVFDILAPVLKFFKLNSYAYRKKSFANP